MKWLKKFDQPGGVWLGIFTAIMIVLCVVAFCLKREIPASVAGVYTTVLGAFAASKTIQKLGAD